MRPNLAYLWKLPVVGLAFTAGSVLGGALVPRLGLPLPEGAHSTATVPHLLVCGLLLALALAVLGRGIAGVGRRRWLALALFCTVCYPLNTVLQTALFAGAAFSPAAAASVLTCVPACLLGTIAATLLFPGPAPRLRLLAPAAGPRPFSLWQRTIGSSPLWRRIISPFRKTAICSLALWQRIGVRAPREGAGPTPGGPAQRPAPALLVVGARPGPKPVLSGSEGPRAESTKPAEAGWERSQPAGRGDRPVAPTSARPCMAGRPAAGDEPPRYRGNDGGRPATADKPRRRGEDDEETESFWTTSGLDSPACRLTLAVLVFPLIYLASGWLMALCTQPYLQHGAHGLAGLDFERILPLQLLFGALCVAATLPTIAAWRRGRRELALCLGLAIGVLTGPLSLAGGAWLPWQLQVARGLELLVASFLYAAALVALLARPGTWPLGGARDRPSAQPRFPAPARRDGHASGVRL